MLTLPLLAAIILLPHITISYNPVSPVRYSDMPCSSTSPCPKWLYCERGACLLCVQCTDLNVLFLQKSIDACKWPVQCKSGGKNLEDAKTCDLLEIDKNTDHIFACSPKPLEHGNPLGTSCTESTTAGVPLAIHQCTGLRGNRLEIPFWKKFEHSQILHNSTTTYSPSDISPTTSVPQANTVVPNEVVIQNESFPIGLLIPVVVGTALGISVASLVIVFLTRIPHLKRNRSPDISVVEPVHTNQPIQTESDWPDEASDMNSVDWSRSLAPVRISSNITETPGCSIELTSFRISRSDRPVDLSSWPSQSSESHSQRYRSPTEVYEPFLESDLHETDDDYFTSSPYRSSPSPAASHSRPRTHNPLPNHPLTRPLLPHQFNTQYQQHGTESDSGTSVLRSDQSHDQFMLEHETLVKQS